MEQYRKSTFVAENLFEYLKTGEDGSSTAIYLTVTVRVLASVGPRKGGSNAKQLHRPIPSLFQPFAGERMIAVM